MTQLRLAFYPLDFSDPNNYLSRMRDAIVLSYPEIEIVNMPGRFKDFIKVDVVWLNWYENFSGRNRAYYLYHAVRRWLKLLIFKCCGTKIIYTVHNRQPHETQYSALNRLFYKCVFSLVDNIVILSDLTRDVIKEIGGKKFSGKIIKIPHPTYLCPKKKYQDNPEGFTVLFFGLLRPYKNIEMLLSVAPSHPEINFVIAGAALDLNYADSLKKAASGLNNVHLILRRLTDEEINKLMDEASVLALPYDLKSSLNSGAAMFALSKGLNVVIPNIGTILELSNRDKVYGYDYNNDSEHQSKFENALMSAFEDFMSDYSQFVRNSEILREEVLSSNSTETLSKIIMKLNLNRGGVNVCELEIYEYITMPVRHTDFEEYARA